MRADEPHRTVLTEHPATETAIMLNGGCHCGRVRYRVDGALAQETICHCSMCRRTTGAPFVVWFTVRSSAFAFTRGAPAQYASSARAKRTFCSHCGTQLTFVHADYPDDVDVTTCSLDDPSAAPPRDHTRTSSRLPWIRVCDGLPEYAEARVEP